MREPGPGVSCRGRRGLPGGLRAAGQAVGQPGVSTRRLARRGPAGAGKGNRSHAGHAPHPPACLARAALRGAPARRLRPASAPAEVVGFVKVGEQARVGRLPAKQPPGLSDGHRDVHRDEREALEVTSGLPGGDAQSAADGLGDRADGNVVLRRGVQLRARRGLLKGRPVERRDVQGAPLPGLACTAPPAGGCAPPPGYQTCVISSRGPFLVNGSTRPSSTRCSSTVPVWYGPVGRGR